MITVEVCLPLVLGTFCKLLIAYFLEQLCSCYFPFLLSAKCYYVIKIRWLRTILISPQITRSSEGKTAFEDRNKLPLIGCIYCIVVFPRIFCEILISIFFVISFKMPFFISSSSSSPASILSVSHSMSKSPMFIAFL